MINRYTTQTISNLIHEYMKYIMTRNIIDLLKVISQIFIWLLWNFTCELLRGRSISYIKFKLIGQTYEELWAVRKFYYKIRYWDIYHIFNLK